MLLSKTLRLFLDGIGQREEYEFYLDKFQSADTPCFALVCPDEESVQQAADVLLFDLQFLLRTGAKTCFACRWNGCDEGPTDVVES